MALGFYLELFVYLNADISDLSKITKCHREAFPDSLSSKLGNRFVRKMLEWYLLGDKFLFFIEENGMCIGYCGGMVGYGSSSGMMQYAMRLGIFSIFIRPWLWVHPKILNQRKFIWKNLRKYFFSNKQSSTIKSNKKDSVGLVVIGVHPDFQGQKVGSKLLKQFDVEVLKKEKTKAHLSVKMNNVQAIRAYERNGWKITYEDGMNCHLDKIYE